MTTTEKAQTCGFRISALEAILLVAIVLLGSLTAFLAWRVHDERSRLRGIEVVGEAPWPTSFEWTRLELASSSSSSSSAPPTAADVLKAIERATGRPTYMHSSVFYTLELDMPLPECRDGMTVASALRLLRERMDDEFKIAQVELLEGDIVLAYQEELNGDRFAVIYDAGAILDGIDRRDRIRYGTALSAVQPAFIPRRGLGAGNGFTPAGAAQFDYCDDYIEEVMDAIISTVHPDHWEDNGGLAASMRNCEDLLIITAPEYIHRDVHTYLKCLADEL